MPKPERYCNALAMHKRNMPQLCHCAAMLTLLCDGDSVAACVHRRVQLTRADAHAQELRMSSPDLSFYVNILRFLTTLLSLRLAFGQFALACAATTCAHSWHDTRIVLMSCYTRIALMSCCCLVFVSHHDPCVHLVSHHTLLENRHKACFSASELRTDSLALTVDLDKNVFIVD